MANLWDACEVVDKNREVATHKGNKGNCALRTIIYDCVQSVEPWPLLVALRLGRYPMPTVRRHKPSLHKVRAWPARATRGDDRATALHVATLPFEHAHPWPLRAVVPRRSEGPRRLY